MRYLQHRTNRKTYWLSVAVVFAIYLLLRVFAPGSSAINEFVLVLVCVPRLHDVGLSGWWVVGPLVPEVLIAISMFTGVPTDIALALGGVLVMMIGGLMVWLGAIPGQPGENRYGLPPVGFHFGKKPASDQPV